MVRPCAHGAGSGRGPALAVIGEKSQALDPTWVERHDLLLSWLPNAEPFLRHPL
jgi:hypothetical protein